MHFVDLAIDSNPSLIRSSGPKKPNGEWRMSNVTVIVLIYYIARKNLTVSRGFPETAVIDPDLANPYDQCIFYSQSDLAL
jgi:hypothetical protein